ncbi:hypothetical protein ACFQ4N_13710 [Oceanobacillus iheyensis]|uniref:hypothetical protein n=1 Tax=Oceanobacillus iheyensis TaxID=182710 RepID=UPI0002E712D1|nr:hypothetical protein [Oceanobacillus iheyensis]
MNNNRLTLVIAVIGSVAILITGALLFNQIHKNHKANELIIEKCFDNFNAEGKVVIKKDGFWSPVTCEKK